MELKTLAARIKKIREVFNLDQHGLGAAIGVKQGSVSVWESGGNVSAKSVEAFKVKFKIDPAWLQYGSGEMFLPGEKAPVVNEEVFDYSLPYSPASISKRFDKAITDYLHKHGLKQRELCDKWQLQESHLSGVRNGYKPITTTMITAALQYGKFNLNFLIGGIGAMYVGEEGKANTDLMGIIKSQQETIDRLSQSGQQKKSA